MHSDGFTWRKSSYSTGQGGQCVEVGAAWRTSSHSTSQGGQCVEVAAIHQAIGIRDTKYRENGHLTVAPETWRRFVTSPLVAES